VAESGVAAPDLASEPSPPPPADRGPLWNAGLLVATWAVVAVGVGLRVRQWAFARPLWVDELLLWRSTRHETFGSLLHPLRGSQSAPVGWLWLQHVVLAVFGDGERALRLVPLLFGCGALALVALLARRLLGPVAALVATAGTACSPVLIYYSNEYKQYSSDVFWTLLLLLVATVWLAEPCWRHAAILGGTAAVAVWFSAAAVLAGVGLFVALGLAELVGRRWRRLAMLAAAGAGVAVSLLPEYFLVLAKNAHDPALREYWRRAFPPEPFTWDGYGRWLGSELRSMLIRPLALHPGWLVVALLVSGAVVLGLRNLPILLAMLLAAVVTVAAATARSYPLADRLVLFLTPIVLIAQAAALDVARLVPKWAGSLPRVGFAAAALAGLAGLVALTVPNVHDAATTAAHPFIQEDGRTVLRYIAEHRGPRDLVLVDRRGSIYAADYYARRVGLGSFGTIDVTSASPTCAPGLAQRLLVREHAYDRIWLVFTHLIINTVVADRAQIATIGHHVTTVTAVGGTADLYDLTVTPDDAGRTSELLREPPYRCLLIDENPPPA
jgi:Dolichyl-phosphate-mannose-protein mannosyltransferase